MRAHARAEVAQAFAARAQEERADRALLAEHHAVESLVGAGQLGEATGRSGRGVPVEAAAVDQDTADDGAVAGQELGRGVVDQVGAVLEGTHQPRRREGRIDEQRQVLLVGERGDRGDVEDVEARVAERLAEQQPRLGPDRVAPGVEVAGPDEGRRDAEARQRVLEQVVRSAVERARGDDVRAGAGDRRDREVQRRLAARRRDRPAAALERGDALLEDGVGRIRDPAVDVAGALHVEERRGVLARLEDERGREVDRHRARAGRRVGSGAGVQRERVEAGIGVAGHGLDGRLRRTIVGYIGSHTPRAAPAQDRLSTDLSAETTMKVSDILRVKGGTLFTVAPDEPLSSALNVMSQQDIGSLVVMAGGELVGMLTFREVIQAVVNNGGTLGNTRVRDVMDTAPLICTPATELDEVRRMMLGRHARYMPVLSEKHPERRGLVLRRRQGGRRQPGLREPDAEGLHPRLAGRKPRRAAVVEPELMATAR